MTSLKGNENSNSEEAPVMFCHPAGGDVSKRLVRGSTPSTRWRKRSTRRRMSDKIYFRVTPKEREQIASKAASSGLEQSSYLRLQALGKSKTRKPRRIRVEWDELRRCMGTINRAGNLLNQLVVAIRLRGGSPDAAQSVLNELSAAARKIMTVLQKS